MKDAAWHVPPTDEVLERLGSSPAGLAPGEAARRLEEHGPNALAPPRPVSPLTILADQLRSVVVGLLAAAALVAFLIGDRLEAAAVAAVLVINTGIGFLVELRARRAMEALVGTRSLEATVLRGGAARRVPAEELVPGDVVEIAAGDAVPADVRLLSAAEARAVEAALTGESLPADKDALAAVDAGAPIAERPNMLHMGTTLATGQAMAVVVATGADTEIGRIERLVASLGGEKRTPLERKLDALGRRLVWLTLGVAAVVALAGLARGLPLGTMIETGLALAVAAVPEGLPAVATIALAVGLRRMARRKALVRELSAVESLGATTVVCTDKTGTLTAGEMTVTRIAGTELELDVTGSGYDAAGEIREAGASGPADDRRIPLLARAAALTSRAHLDGEVVGDPTDAALLVLGRKAGVEREELRRRLVPDGERPFSSERRTSASFHREDGRRVVFVKGAPDRVLAMCRRAAGAEGDAALEPTERERLLARNGELAEEGLRVIAVAWGEAPDTGTEPPDDLVFLALLGLIDPPAQGVRETIEALREAGIRTFMITGDQALTAEAVGRELGLVDADRGVLDGRALHALDDAGLVRALDHTGAFSRVDPEDKLRIVEALQDRGEIVAMLGDGVNDAAALRRADVGVAMGRRGTDVARETAAVVLQDDRFTTIGAAVEQGRIIFDNIRKFVFYLFSCNLAEVLVLLLGTLAGLPLPLLPLQILWLNLVTDTFPALALALEPGEPGIMRRTPRDPDAAILSRRFVGAMAFHASLITAVTLGGYVWALRGGAPGAAGTISFMTLALAQLFHLGTARSRTPVLAPRRIVENGWAVGAVVLVIVLQAAAVHWHALARILDTVPLGAREWAVVVGLAAVPALVGQGLQVVQRRRGLTAASATPDGRGARGPGPACATRSPA